MKNFHFLFLFLAILLLSTCKCDHPESMQFSCNNAIKQPDYTQNISSISFGSCCSENKEQPILNDIVTSSPDLFVYLGDNVYVDSKKCEDFFSTYSKLACKPEFQNLISHIPVIATWDDHDYGMNDVGKEYPLKEESKSIFLRFWQEPQNSSRFNHEGIYHSLYFGDDSHRVQIILLDMRTFRSRLKSNANGYCQDIDLDKTFLGDEQWNWLFQELKKPAKIRIIASSTQFGSSHTGWESWENFPLEKERMATTIYRARANNVFFISGDVHYSELSKYKHMSCYPLYDATSSGLTNVDEEEGNNTYRISPTIHKVNYGNIKIHWDQFPLKITYTIYGLGNSIEYEKTIDTSPLHF